ncbi:hypothetical protein TNCV_973561 [Trichonephila clavipes]|nr:hypothetical protein TNCV_973561 [Trichonephila clavipes]
MTCRPRTDVLTTKLPRPGVGRKRCFSAKESEVIRISRKGEKDIFHQNNATVPKGQPIGVTVHFTQQPIREQSLSSQPSQKLFQTHHPDEAPKPRLPDSIDHPIAVMPPSRM